MCLSMWAIYLRLIQNINLYKSHLQITHQIKYNDLQTESDSDDWAVAPVIKISSLKITLQSYMHSILQNQLHQNQ